MHHFAAQPLPSPKGYFHENILPDSLSEPPLAHLDTISLCPITCHLRGDQRAPRSNLPPGNCREPIFLQKCLSLYFCRMLISTSHQPTCVLLPVVQGDQGKIPIFPDKHSQSSSREMPVLVILLKRGKPFWRCCLVQIYDFTVDSICFRA